MLDWFGYFFTELWKLELVLWVLGIFTICDLARLIYDCVRCRR